MMDHFPGWNSPGNYMDTILMDTYGGGDVPYVTAIGVTKNNGNPRMFIANGSKGSSTGWSYLVEAITTGNIGSQSVANASTLGGLSASYGQAANTIVARNGNGYIYTGYIHSDTGNNENPPVSQVIVTNGSDGFYRKASLAHLKASMGLDAVNNTADANKSVNYATSAGNADTVDGLHFHWSGQSGQPTWLWGGNDASNMYVYNPSNFSVNYATYAANAYNNTFNFGNGTYFTSSSAAQSALVVNGRQFAFQADSNVAQLIPANDNFFRLGVNGYRWKSVNAYEVNGGNVKLSGNAITFGSNGPKLYIQYSNGLYICKADGGINKSGIAIWVNTDLSGSLTPTADNGMDCASGSTRWKQVYAVNSAISTSDRREKCDISYIGSDSEFDTVMSDNQLIELIKGIRPVVYRRNNGESGRPHHGLISQDFEELMHKIGLKDHAGFIKSPKTRDVEIEEEVEEIDENGQKTVKLQKKLVQEVIEGEYVYGFRYEELITDIIRFCQIQQKQSDDQQETIRAHENRIKELEDKMDILLSKLA